MEKIKKMRPDILLFLIVVAFVSIGNSFSDSIFANYFKEVYHVTAVQRGFLEFPRELPGMLCVLVVTALSSLGNYRIAFIAQILAATGLIVLGLYTPVFYLMTIFLFVNSMGMHLFMPLFDSIGMSLAEPGKIGRRMGEFVSVKFVFLFLAGLAAFFLFRFNIFSFKTNIKVVFLAGAGAFILAAGAAGMLVERIHPPIKPRQKLKLIFRKQYRYYYSLTVLHGVQKQIAFVYGSWVIIELLAKGADVMSLLIITAAFFCVFFMKIVGKWMDRYGIKKMMYFDALTFIIIYVIYGFIVWGITAKVLPSAGISVIAVYILFVLDRLSMQIGVVNSVYLKSIALSDEDVTATLSTGLSLDHLVSIVAAALGGLVWAAWGSQWVFFMAAAFSLGNLVVAYKVNPEKEREAALQLRGQNDCEKCN